MIKMNSFIDLVKSRRTDNLYLVNAKDKSRSCWYYLELKPEKAILFERINADTQVNLDEWGKIIISGWGKEPPLKIRDKIKAEGANFSLTDKEKEQEIFFVKSVTTDGVPYYSFVTVPLYLAKEFTQKCNVGGFDYREYGAVVYSDWGVNPTERVLQLMEVGYNMDRNKIAPMLYPESVT